MLGLSYSLVHMYAKGSHGASKSCRKDIHVVITSGETLFVELRVPGSGACR